ncbi:hypothetical protein ACNHKD_14855 [Methylocystis sp. JAN1]|uniref:hypothetical protein n=1 Tax=Methylocystis sp. JAN1 TaxID=3397211 RepID=UPI003FA1D0C8
MLEDESTTFHENAQPVSAPSDFDADIDLVWQGPFGWPGFEAENGLPAIPSIPGVYLMTVDYHDGFLLYVAGLTEKTVPHRFKQHTRAHLKGEWNVLDIDDLRNGVRTQIWHGWTEAPKTSPERMAEFLRREEELTKAIKRQLGAYRVFVCDVRAFEERIPRIYERVEASMMNTLYLQPRPFCDIPDCGMSLRPRRTGEAAIRARIVCSSRLYGTTEIVTI